MRSKKKILYIESNRDGSIGGSYYSMLYLIEGLDKQKYEPHVLFYQDNVLVPEFKNLAKVYIHDLNPTYSAPITTLGSCLKWPYRFITGILLKQIKLKIIINEIKPDLVHLNNGPIVLHEWILACFLNKIKIVVHDRGARPPYSLQTKFFMRYIDALIAISDHYRKYVVESKLKIKRIVRIYNGLDYCTFNKKITEANTRKIVEDLNIQDAKHVVGIIGNIDRWKGQHVVLEAIKSVKNIYPDIVCLIVGKVLNGAEPYKQELDDYIAENGLEKNIKFTGFIKDIPNTINALDILIHASIVPEPFGRVILEGMAASKPIVATNDGGVPEIVVDNEMAILVPLGDANKMADAITFLLSNKTITDDMTAKGKKRLIDMFSTQKMVHDVENLYDNIFCEKIPS